MAAEKEYIRKMFVQFYDKNWKGKGREYSQEAFVAEVKKIDPQSGFTKSRLSKILNGHSYTTARYLEIFARVLGVELEDFYPQSVYAEKYGGSPEYQNEVAKYNNRIARECFGLDLSFLYGLKQLIDFDSEFPTFAPLECITADPEEGYPFGLKYERVQLVPAAEIDKGRGLFQVSRDGEVFNLSPVDMKYLKTIQNSVVKIVKGLFAEHRQELESAALEATYRCKEFLKGGKAITLGRDPFSPEELQKLDNNGIYTEEEYKKYDIPNPPEGLRYTAAHTEKGWGDIHIGRGALPPDELVAFFESKRRKKGGGAGEAVPDGAEQSGGGQVPDSEGQGATVTESSGRQKQKGGSNNGKARKR